MKINQQTMGKKIMAAVTPSGPGNVKTSMI